MSKTGTFDHFFRLLLGGEFAHYVVAALAPRHVEPAIHALREAGFGHGEGNLKHRTGDCTGHEEVCLCSAADEPNIVGKVLHKMMANFTEEGQVCKVYRDELRVGHEILAVRANSRQDAEKIAAVLVCHGGHQMRYFNSLSYVDLASPAGVT